MDRLDHRPEIRTRNDLLALIGGAVRYAKDDTAKALADHILREMRAAGLRIRQVKRRKN